jgi:hypothetical protein
MSAPLTLIFLDSEDLYYRINVNDLIDATIEYGFEVNDFVVENTLITWDEFITHPLLISSINDLHKLSFKGFHEEMKFEIRTQLGRGEEMLEKPGRVWVSVSTSNTPYFWNSEYDSILYSKFFIEYSKILYSILLPAFGWIDFNYGLFTDFDDIESLRLPSLYWANFFGTPYIKKFGKEMITNAPAWDMQILPDGGYLYLLAPSPGLTANHVDVTAVKEYFHVEKVR